MALRAAGTLAVKLAQTAGAFASGRAYVQRYFPPGYREPAIKLVKAFEQAATGAGLYQVVNTFLNDDGTEGGNGFSPRKKYNPRPKYQTRGRFKRGTNRYRKRQCNCKGRRFKKYSF